MSQPNPQQEIEEVCEQSLIDYKKELIRKIKKEREQRPWDDDQGSGYCQATDYIINLIKQ